MAIPAAGTLRHGAALAAFMLLPATDVQAQQQYLGQWYCEFSYTEYDNNGNRTSGFTQAFGTVVQPDGSFYAEGQERNIMGLFYFQAQGVWEIGSAPGRGVTCSPAGC